MTTETRLTLRDVAHLPPLGVSVPANVAFSPDGRYLAYLYSPEGTLTRELWAFDRESGREFRVIEPPEGGESDANVSREEALRRERQRQLAAGVTTYAWSERGDTLLVPMRGEIWIKQGIDGDLRRVDSTGGCIDPRLSPDGTKGAYVHDGDLYALDLVAEGASAIQLTFDASPADAYGDRVLTNGLAEFVAQEEMGRAAGFWWSPGGEWLAFEQVDHSPVPLYLIPHPGADRVDVEAHRYPFAGETNVRVRLGVVRWSGGAIAWLPLGDDDDVYVARVNWTPDGKVLAQVESRDQTRLALRRIDPATSDVTVLWIDEVEPWVNLTNDLKFVRRDGGAEDDYRILWSSERGGPRDLYLYDRGGGLLAQLTHGEVCIDGVVSVDADAGWVYFEGWRQTPLERQLFRVSLEGGAVEQLTDDPGTNGCVLAPDHRAYFHAFSSTETPPTRRIRGLDGSDGATLPSGRSSYARAADLGLRPPRLVRVTARDGETLHGALYHPPDLSPGAKAPVIVLVYGGPHVQYVGDHWGMTINLRAQLLAREGFLVFVLDNRGAARRGLAFEGRIARNMGDLEVQDQLDGVRFLETLPEADTSQVGVYGWSYGGYMALMCLARAPEVFKVAVAGAPVTSWDGYDTHYTERYMGTPQNNPDGYRAASVLTHVENIKGKLLIVHGMIDENVHFRHSGRLITALTTAGIPHEVMPLPEERHTPRREDDRIFMESRILEFFKQHL